MWTPQDRILHHIITHCPGIGTPTLQRIWQWSMPDIRYYLKRLSGCIMTHRLQPSFGRRGRPTQRWWRQMTRKTPSTTTSILWAPTLDTPRQLWTDDDALIADMVGCGAALAMQSPWVRGCAYGYRAKSRHDRIGALWIERYETLPRWGDVLDPEHLIVRLWRSWPSATAFTSTVMIIPIEGTESIETIMHWIDQALRTPTPWPAPESQRSILVGVSGSPADEVVRMLYTAIWVRPLPPLMRPRGIGVFSYPRRGTTSVADLPIKDITTSSKIWIEVPWNYWVDPVPDPRLWPEWPEWQKQAFGRAHQWHQLAAIADHPVGHLIPSSIDRIAQWMYDCDPHWYTAYLPEPLLQIPQDLSERMERDAFHILVHLDDTDRSAIEWWYGIGTQSSVLVPPRWRFRHHRPIHVIQACRRAASLVTRYSLLADHGGFHQ